MTAIAIMAVIAPLTGTVSAHQIHRAPGHHAKMDTSSNEGFLITTTNNIRINASGEVVSKPAPIIEKERKFNERALKEIMKQP